MTRLVGKSASGGIAIGSAYLPKRREINVRRVKITDACAEITRFDAARKLAAEQLSMIHEKALKQVGEAGAQIFEIHIMLLDDEDFCEAVTQMISSSLVNAEYAVAAAGDNLAQIFGAMEDGYMQARGADIKDVANRIIACLTGSEAQTEKPVGGVVICADDLSPSETVQLDRSSVLAFVTAYGSQSSHTAILARSMGIPAVIGMGESFLNCVSNGDKVIVNGFSGEVMLAPDKAAVEAAEERQREQLRKRELLNQLKGKENVTLDGRHINIFANIGSVEEAGEALLNDAGGIGLFRSEFIYLGRSAPPNEDEQFRIYKRVLQSMAGKKVIIRTLDIGADKQADYLNLDSEENPALGMRAIRLCLSQPELFKAQLRALFRASAYGSLGIMFPMVAAKAELNDALELCRTVKAELAADGVPYSDSVEIGIMIETPAAAIISDVLAPMVDFFSVGTNDLTQYTLACDRQNARLERFCDAHHTAVLRLIELSAKNAHDNGIWIGICGELAADLSLTETFLRMGIDELSVPPTDVLELRERVRGINVSDTTSKKQPD